MNMAELRDYVEDMYVAARLIRLNCDLGSDGYAARYYEGRRDAYQKVLELLTGLEEKDCHTMPH